MSSRKKKWLIAAAALSVTSFVVLIAAASWAARRYEPYIRQQTIAYLEKRFDSDVTLKNLRIRIPTTSPLRLAFTAGRGTLARVEGTGLSLRQRHTSPELGPILALKSFSFEVDLGTVFDSPKTINRVQLDGLEITIPPKGERAPLSAANSAGNEPSTGILIEQVIASNTRLVLVPKIRGKKPLRFDIASLRLESVGQEAAMTYEATLTNPKPPGLIRSNGSFGPWSTDEPGDTPLKGRYVFENADLGVFPAIAGILHSTGDFEGSLSNITAHGTATVPDFRLVRAGNRVPLTTVFEVLVDGSNGNTILQPVKATLGSTQFTTSGAVLRKNGEDRRSIDLDVVMSAGKLNDVLRLAMKGSPFMEGELTLKSKISIPPLDEKVKDKLLLDGEFGIRAGRFLRDETQDKIDSLSRRGQGQPKNEEISDVFSDMKGSFHMEDQTITFRNLNFATPGASIRLKGNYNLKADAIDFHGAVALQAHMSNTMTGWKRWVLKPIDPFFAKKGAGTFLRIKIDGSSKEPHFGLDHGPG